MKNTLNTCSRRNFLKSVIGTSLGSAGAYTTLSSLTMANAFAQPAADGYKALVCVFMFGGNDSYNMVVPRSGSAYTEYATARENLAVPQSELLPISPATSDGNQYGFHPSMPEMQAQFNAGNLAVVANVGALVVPTTRNNFINDNVPLPPRLFSHNDQQDFWQSLKTDVPQPRGWAGRMADLMMSVNENQRLSMNISMSGSNLLQVGNATIPYAMSASGVVPMAGLDRSGGGAQLSRRIELFDQLMNANTPSVFGDEYARVVSRAESLSTEVGGAINSVPDFTTPLPADNRLAATLGTVAKVIASRFTLDVSRQIFFVGIGGWDTHADQLTRHPALLATVSGAMDYFYKVTEELNIQNRVTTFTAADFGRTLTSNGDGSDHGWGSHQLVMGGAVSGGDIYGEMPPLVIEGPQDSGRGRIIPTLSVDQYSATLASWYGLSASNVAEVFPNLGSFNSVNLGFV